MKIDDLAGDDRSAALDKKNITLFSTNEMKLSSTVRVFVQF